MATQKSILIIDDEITLRHTLALILRRAGYEVITTRDGPAAQDYLKRLRFNLVFLNINLSDDRGLSLLPEIKSAYPELPVVILTAHLSQVSRNCCKQKGICEYLLKPVDPERILDVVARMLGETPGAAARAIEQ